MVVHSPELSKPVLSLKNNAEPTTQDSLPLEPLFICLASLNCLGLLASSTEALKDHLNDTFRVKLSESLGSRFFMDGLFLWIGFERFSQTLIEQVGTAERDRLKVEFALSQTTAAQLLNSTTTWQALQSEGAAQFERIIAGCGGVAAVEMVLREAYRQQRDAVGREILFRTLPLMVLWLAVFAAGVMAFLFTRSLISG